MIYTYMSLLTTSHNLSPLKKCWFHPQTPNPKKKKHQKPITKKKMTQGIVGCTPTNVITPTRNPNKYHGYTAEGYTQLSLE